MKNISIDEAFSKLTQEQKEAFHKMIGKYNGLPNLFQIMSEIESKENSDTEKRMYKSALLASALFYKSRIDKYEKEDGREHSYRVAVICGGIMEDPNLHYEDEQIITAKSEKEAEGKYNKLNNCNYYYSKVLGKLD